MNNKLINKIAEVKKNLGDLTLTYHASERVLERFGYTQQQGLDLAKKVLSDIDVERDNVRLDGNKLEVTSGVSYIRVVVDYTNMSVVTIIPRISTKSDTDADIDFMFQVSKELGRKRDIIIEELQKELRDMNIVYHEAKLLLAQKELNLLKAKRPETIEIITKDISTAKSEVYYRGLDVAYIKRKISYVQSLLLV